MHVHAKRVCAVLLVVHPAVQLVIVDNLAFRSSRDVPLNWLTFEARRRRRTKQKEKTSEKEQRATQRTGDW
jgi:hypothetical protein